MAKLNREAVLCSAFTPEAEAAKAKVDTYEKEIKSIRKRLGAVDLLAAILGVSGTVLGLIESELYYKYNRYYEESRSSPFLNSLRLIVSLSTLVLLFCIYKRYSLSNQLIPSPNKHYPSLILELMVCVMHWPPYFDWTFSLNQLHGSLTLTGDAVFNLILVSRLYLVLRVLGAFSKWRSDIAQKACKEADCQASLRFTFKALLQTSPFPLVSISLVMVVCLCGLALRTFERPFPSFNIH